MTPRLTQRAWHCADCGDRCTGEPARIAQHRGAFGMVRRYVCRGCVG